MASNSGAGWSCAVKFLVNRGALEPEIRAQINDLAALLQQRNGEFRRDAVRQREKNDLRLFGEQGGVGLGEAEGFGARMMGEFRENLRERLAGVLARGDGGEFDVRMRQQQAHQFLAGITGGADDADLYFFIHLSGSFAFHATRTNT